MAIKIMRGDSYNIPINISQNGIAVTPSMVREIEIAIGDAVRKYYSRGEVLYAGGTWYFRLSQDESFALEDSAEVYVRVGYPGSPSDVIGKKAGMIIATESGSTEVL